MTDVLATLKTQLQGSDKIDIQADVFGSGPIDTVFKQFIQGSLVVDGSNLLSGDAVTATVKGSAQTQPFGDTTITAVFTASQGGVAMKISAVALPQWTPARAFGLTGFPFDNLTIPRATLALDAKVPEVQATLKAEVDAAWSGKTLGSGLFQAEYQGSGKPLGFLAGFVVTGGFTPVDAFGALGGFTVQKVGAFVSTITAKDLELDGQPITFPSEVDPGFTVFGSLALTDNIAILSDILGRETTLDLLAFLPEDTPTRPTITASLTANQTSGAFTFEGLELDWDTAASTLALTASGKLVEPSLDVDLTLAGKGTLAYAPPPTGSLGLFIEQWAQPFGLPNLIIDNFGFSLTFGETVDFTLGGTFTIGEGDGAVKVTVIGSIANFEVPNGIVFQLTPADKGKSVTVPQLVQDFVPEIDLNDVPLLKEISFKEISVIAVATKFTFDGKVFDPGIGATGDISFFGLNLDFAFNFNSKAEPPVIQAKGTINDNGGPLVVSLGGVQLLKLSDTTGTKGPSGCIDTSASGFCSGSAYFNFDGSVDILGLAKASLKAQANKEMFEFAVASSFLGVDIALATEFDPGKLGFSTAFSFNDTKLSEALTIGPLVVDGVTIVPKFSLVPTVDFSFTAGTLPNPHFGFNMSFEYLGLDFSFGHDFDLSSVANAFEDFGKFILDWILASPEIVLEAFLALGKLLAKLLHQLGTAIEDAAKAVAQFFGETIEDAMKIVTDVWNELEQCAQDTANSLLPS